MLKLISSIIIVTTSFSVNATIYNSPPIKTCTFCDPPMLSLEQTKQCVIISNKIQDLKKQILKKEKTVNLYNQSEVDSYNKLVTTSNSLVEKYQLNCAGKSSLNNDQALRELNK